MEKNFAIIPAMWEKAGKEGTLNKLCSFISVELDAVLGMVICDDPMSWKYAIAVVSNEKTDKTLTEFIVPEATWAIFYGEGTQKSIQDLTLRIHTQWLPSSGYEFGNAPEIEVYYNADPNNAKYEIWLPVVAKA